MKSIPIPNANNTYTLWNNELKAQHLRSRNKDAYDCNIFSDSIENSAIYTPNNELSPIKFIIGGPKSQSPLYNNALNPLPEPGLRHSSSRSPSPQQYKRKRTAASVSSGVNEHQLFQLPKDSTKVQPQSYKDKQQELADLRKQLESTQDKIIKSVRKLIADNESLKLKNNFLNELHQIVTRLKHQ